MLQLPQAQIQFHLLEKAGAKLEHCLVTCDSFVKLFIPGKVSVLATTNK